VLSSQALITPDVGTAEEGAPDFPHHLFLTFFTLHVLVVWAAIYLTWGRRMRRGGATTASRSSLRSRGGIHVHLQRDHGNQLWLPQQEAPTASILDVLGPWPVYLVAEITIVLIVWALYDLAVGMETRYYWVIPKGPVNESSMRSVCCAIGPGLWQNGFINMNVVCDHSDRLK